jgi:hypothetical protein
MFEQIADNVTAFLTSIQVLNIPPCDGGLGYQILPGIAFLVLGGIVILTGAIRKWFIWRKKRHVINR